jgi:hypothetical protein
MAKVKLDIGAEIDTLNKGELDDSLARHVDAQAQALLRGIKYFRMPTMWGSITNGTVSIGEVVSSGGAGGSGNLAYPREGYAWSIGRINVIGLATGTAPDFLTIGRGGVALPANMVVTVNGNDPTVTFGKLQLVYLPGERLQAASVGSLTTTAAVISINAEGIEIPAEMLGKLV